MSVIGDIKKLQKDMGRLLKVVMGLVVGGSGEANTASNVGTVGTGVFKQKVGVDLELYKINSPTNALTVALVGTDRVDLTVNPGNIKLDDLGETDNNTDLDASATKHGLMMKFPGGSTNFLREDGTWQPAGGGGVDILAVQVFGG